MGDAGSDRTEWRSDYNYKIPEGLDIAQYKACDFFSVIGIAKWKPQRSSDVGQFFATYIRIK